MAYIAGLIIVGLFFLILHYFTELTKHQKNLVTAIVLIVVLSAIAFNTYSGSQRDNMMAAINKYNQHKTIICNGVKVDDKNYSLSVGTYTFIGLKNTPGYGEMISAFTCK
jgi:hypothetical protein